MKTTPSAALFTLMGITLFANPSYAIEENLPPPPPPPPLAQANGEGLSHQFWDQFHKTLNEVKVDQEIPVPLLPCLFHADGSPKYEVDHRNFEIWLKWKNGKSEKAGAGQKTLPEQFRETMIEMKHWKEWLVRLSSESQLNEGNDALLRSRRNFFLRKAEILQDAFNQSMGNWKLEETDSVTGSIHKIESGLNDIRHSLSLLNHIKTEIEANGQDVVAAINRLTSIVLKHSDNKAPHEVDKQVLITMIEAKQFKIQTEGLTLEEIQAQIGKKKEELELERQKEEAAELERNAQAIRDLLEADH